jgi:uncharacterized metal-binding protein
MNCLRQDKEFPEVCTGYGLSKEQIEKIKDLYRDDPVVSKMALAAAEIEGTYYCKLTRVEELIAFARRINANKIGIATCIGLMNETKTFVKILDANKIESFTAICKIGSIDKTEIGVDESLKVQTGSFEAICNPIMQARLLNKAKTDLNVMVGLCVGHDALFNKYSKAPVTTLITKDRVLGHNPASALYSFYYQKLLQYQNI